jgi:alkanesulfonate monooxygenase SsuD/methylene tetrahydromethanopterin reductase-like flavin-dependent oxidoreductase (luciferase family)
MKETALNWLHLVPGVNGNLAREKQRAAYRAKGGDDAHRIDEYLLGSVEEVRDQLRSYRDAGYDRLIVGPAISDPNEVEKQVEYYAEEFDEFLY